MVNPFLVDVLGAGCNVSGNNDYCCLIYIVEIFHMAFLGHVLGICIVYYVSYFFAAFHVIIYFRGKERTVVMTSLMH